MISDVVAARRISDLMLDVSGKLNDSILDVVRSTKLIPTSSRLN